MRSTFLYEDSLAFNVMMWGECGGGGIGWKGIDDCKKNIETSVPIIRLVR